jgi:hypothetical protein
MGQNAEQRIPKRVSRALGQLAIVGEVAETFEARMNRHPPEHYVKIEHSWPTLEVYAYLVNHFFRQGEVVTRQLHKSSKEGTDDAVFNSLLERYIGLHVAGFLALLQLGRTLALAVNTWGWWVLRQGAHADTDSRGALDKALRFFNAPKALERRLQRYRERQGRVLDQATLFEAYATNEDEVGKALLSSAQAKDTRHGLIDFPMVLLEGMGKNVRSKLRTAYLAEAPEKMVQSLEEWRPTAEAEGPEDTLLRELSEKQVRAALRAKVAATVKGRQHEVVREYWAGLAKGYRLSGKLDNSFRQYWGQEYTRKRRMLNRVRNQHPGLLEAIEAVTIAG